MISIMAGITVSYWYHKLGNLKNIKILHCYIFSSNYIPIMHTSKNDSLWHLFHLTLSSTEGKVWRANEQTGNSLILLGTPIMTTHGTQWATVGWRKSHGTTTTEYGWYHLLSFWAFLKISSVCYKNTPNAKY